MEAAHISPELPIRWVVSADRTVEIKEEVTELGCDQANERILQEETPPSSITERGRWSAVDDQNKSMSSNTRPRKSFTLSFAQAFSLVLNGEGGWTTVHQDLCRGIFWQNAPLTIIVI
ncbi:UNVERIFIED_CONTAM: hypothetical protein FKN15_051017 [Acipenser sinensis]